MDHRVKKGVQIEFSISPQSKLGVLPCLIMWIASSVCLFQYHGSCSSTQCEIMHRLCVNCLNLHIYQHDFLKLYNYTCRQFSFAVFHLDLYLWPQCVHGLPQQ